ncbi:unnamed protein product [Medioppia subpectinata]|uniref:Uncharacterized protein n=1 Tax=Medioppia subpectinata TaxID=1979941 RepID=A0A7R9LJF7_9ACAR|nr:unnamed protein product [Medioppia subpectinata]CAG2119294.1 unnamed protein product [Medioppia subpectinata]
MFYGDEGLDCNETTIKDYVIRYCKETKEIKAEAVKFIAKKFKASTELQAVSKMVFSTDKKAPTPAQCRNFTSDEPHTWHLCSDTKVDEFGAKDIRILFLNVLLEAQKKDTKINLLKFICYTKEFMSKTAEVHNSNESQAIVKQHMYDTFHWANDKLDKVAAPLLKELTKDQIKFAHVCDLGDLGFAGEATPTYQSILMNWFVALNKMLTNVKIMSSKKG